MKDAPSPQTPARYIMIGGFLGAGKTTSVGRLARHLSDQGLRVGLITNDQGSGLVDTAMLATRGFPVEEIPGGCFCCRFNSLVEAAQRLTAESRPEVFIAEPVGSCTDLVATVSYPLRKLYGAQYSIAPLSVLVDPIRALRVLGLEEGGRFTEKVLYIYRKQLEEADVIVVNKCDAVGAAKVSALRGELSRRYPDATVFEVSARTGAGLGPWFEHLTGTSQVPRTAMNVDYQTYAEGEALLGWFNATFRIQTPSATDGNLLIHDLASAIQERLVRSGSEVAHLKMTLDSQDGLGDLAVVNLVRNDFVPELSQSLEDEFTRGELTLNLRAEADPDELAAAVAGAFEAMVRLRPGLVADRLHVESFRPGKPQPTHRIVHPV